VWWIDDGFIKLIDKAAFLETPARYERRTLAFYDIMSWTRKIEAAGEDVERITVLQNMVGLFSALQGERFQGTRFATRITTFSDNVVISTEPWPSGNLTFLLHLGAVQLLAAQCGFLLRGGITIGNIVHDERVVFGPALNRAVEIEKCFADKPRIVVDAAFLSEFGDFGTLMAMEDDIHFITPWTTDFVNLLYRTNPTYKGQSRPEDELIKVVQFLGAELKGMNGLEPDVKNRQRLIWLYKRISASVLGEVDNSNDIIQQMFGNARRDSSN
jgi:hypothetical protein